MAKNKLQKTDGLGPLEIKKIRSALRLVWHRSHARQLVVKRCTGDGGFLYCERCLDRTPSLKVDHIVQVGAVDAGHLLRLFCPSQELQGLCGPCHNAKTKAERKAARQNTQPKCKKSLQAKRSRIRS